MFISMTLVGFQCSFGLSPFARLELQAVGIDQYLGDFEPASSEAIGEWTKYTFDADGGDGPICIDGSPFTVFTRVRDPKKIVFFLNGGGACWQDFYYCSPQATQAIPAETPGIFSASFDTGSEIIDNPLADWSTVFVSYCDGSVFAGDNEVVDPNFPLGPVRYHRGLRNLSAAMDLTHAEFPNAHRMMVSGASAGGVGAAAFAPFLFRFTYGDWPILRVFNDAGPIAVNLDQTGAAIIRALDWDFGKFYPASCTTCSAIGQQTVVVDWRLDNDWGVKEAFYSTDGDATNSFFLQATSQAQYRQILLDGHDPLHDEHPYRYKRFIRSADNSHTALGTPLFYVGTANGVPLYEWTEAFASGAGGWVDIVEDFVPLP